jgi:hypothetical protein
MSKTSVRIVSSAFALMTACVEVVDAALVSGEEAGADPGTFGAEHEHGCKRSAVGDPSGSDDGQLCDRIDDRRDERRGRHVTGVAACLGALCGDDVDARVGSAPCVFDGAHLADHDRAGVVGLGDERSRVGERVGDHADALVERRVHEPPGVGPLAEQSDPERPVGQLACRPDLLDQPAGVAFGRAADHAETAGHGHRSGERAGRVSPTHRRVEDRVRDAEQVADAGLEPHGLLHRTFDGVESHAAVVGLGFERGAQANIAELFEQAVEQAEVHAADELGVLLRELVERAVVQDGDAVVTRLRLEPTRAEHPEEMSAPRIDTRITGEALPRFGTDDPPFGARGVIDGAHDRSAVALRSDGSVGQDASGELVLTRGQADRDLGRRPPVDLGRPSGTGTAPVVEPLVVDLEEPFVGEAVEVVRGDPPLDAHRLRRLVAADPRALRNDVLVEAAPVGLSEHADDGEVVAFGLEFGLEFGLGVHPIRQRSF